MDRASGVTAPRVVILGGGTAGWMAACLFARALPRAAVTVVESPDIGIVGVGEGSTPQLRHLFAMLGIEERAWMAAAQATYKVGIRFEGWSRRAGYERYVHPFPSAVDLHTEPAFHAAALARRTGADVPAHPDGFFLNSWLADHGRAPIATDNFPFDMAYGYHFDAHLVGEVLRAEAMRRGVRHLQRRILHVAVDAGGAVTQLVANEGEAIAGDLFVDASGFHSVIAQGALGEPFRPFAENLFVDAAVVLPTPLGPAGPGNHTLSVAMRHGWRWHIPLRHRAGNGYVYASSYCSADEAEAELRGALGVAAAGVEARHLRMKVGRIANSWTSNCLAIGLAQGFIEPLEATALHLVQATVEGFLQAWTAGGLTPRHRDGFNAGIARRYEGIRDYIVAHYRLNQRGDTDFWRDNAANDRLSDSLKALMTCWFTGGDLVSDVEQRGLAGYYAPASWGCLFAGYGTFPDEARLRAPAAPPASLATFLDRCGANFPSHAAALAAV